MTLAPNGLANAVAYAYTFADATARLAASGFTSTDIGKLALQQDTNALYLLTATTPSWVLIGGTFVSPLTSQDDLIIGGASGTPTRLAKGTDGQVLTVDPTTHHLVWATPSGGGGGGGAVYPQRTPRLWHGDGKWSAGSTINTATGGTWPAYYPTPAPSASNHPYVDHSIMLAAGSYTVSAVGQFGNIYGLHEVWIDGTLVATLDWYTSATTDNNHLLTATFTLATSGRHTLRMTANGKNASSGNYYITVSYYWIALTGTETTDAS